jgi:hypothetical protein
VLAKQAGDPAVREIGRAALNPIPHRRQAPRARTVAPTITSFLSEFKAHFDPLPSRRSYVNIDATCS